ncbi:LOW QUALITY PROTEIN: hypothetical protein HID58_080018, partial [Brassica napus]
LVHRSVVLTNILHKNPLTSTIFYQVPEGLLTVRELLRGHPCFWANFSPKRVRRDVALYRSRFQPYLPTEEGSESSMDGQAGGGSGEQFNLDGLSELDFPPTEGGSNEVPDFSKAARMVNGAQMARLKAEVADKEIAHLKDELEISRRRERESFEKEVNNAYRRGKREIVEFMKSHHDKFSQKFRELKGRYKALADYRDQAGGGDGEQFNLDGLSEFDFPLTEGGSIEVPDFSKAARMVNAGLLMINRGFDTSKQEAQMARFKAEVADKEIAHLKDELESSRRRKRESFEKEFKNAYRRGKREIVKFIKSRRDKVSQKFEELKGRYKALADYRECRGTVGGLYLTQLPDYSFTNESRKIFGSNGNQFPFFPTRRKPRLEILAGEVDQPVAPLDVNDYSIGRSMSGDCDLGD